MTPHILLVEDEFLIRIVVSEALADAGFEITEAEDTDTAADLIDGHGRYDLMVTDIQMPGRIDGVELGRLIRARRPGIPVIYTTGRPEAMGKLALLGPDEAFVGKPYPPSEIVGIAWRMLGQRARV